MRLRRVVNLIAFSLPLDLGACSVLQPNRAPTVTLGANPLEGEQPLIVSFTASTDTEGRPLTYAWDFGPGNPSEGGSSRTHAYLQAGSYPVTVTVSDGRVETSDTVTVEVRESGKLPDPDNEPPTATLNADATGGEAPLEVAFSTRAEDAN